jgi:hypothetical protein
MPLGVTFANTMWDHFFGGAAATPTANLRIALYTVAPDYNTGAGGTECNYTGYARIVVPNNSANFAAASNRKKANNIRINLVSPDVNTTIVAWGIFDSVNAWVMGKALDVPKVANAGDPVFFDPGDLSFEFI